MGKPARITIGEHTPGKREPSNSAVRDLLDLAVRAAGAERGFVVSMTSGSPDSVTIHAAVNLRGDGRNLASAALARAALHGVRHGTWIDPRAARMTADSPSVRGLGLRRFASEPVPCGGPRRAAVVVDSRLTPTAHPRGTLELLPGIARLLADPLRDLALPDPRRPQDLAATCGLVGSAPLFRRAVERATAYGASRLPVLLTGESGCGKEGFARLVHLAGMPPDAPIVALNCAAVPTSLVEAELFGSARGAYTGADADRPGVLQLADGGTLFLDEIGDMPPSMQAKLLRVLQDGRFRPVGSARETEVSVRIVTATHRDLESLVARERFRHDLLYRLGVLRVHIPAMRERLDDLEVLCRALLDRLSRHGGTPPLDLDAEAVERLRRHDWPGNVRELRSVLARAGFRARNGIIRAPDLDFPERGGPGGAGSEADTIRDALRSSGTIAGAARRIGWTRQKLYRRMRALGVSLDRA